MKVNPHKLVYMIGSDLKVKGGIASVERVILNNWNSGKFEIIHFPTFIDGNKVAKLFFFIHNFFKLLYCSIKNHPGIYHIHFSSRASFYRKSFVILLGKLLGTKIVLHAHSGEFNIFFQQEVNKLIQAYIRKILNLADVLIALSGYWKEFYGNIFSKDIKIIYNPVFPIRKTNISPKNKNILFLGRLGELKGFDDIITVFTKLSSSFPEIRLFAAGDGDLDKYQRLITSNNLQKNIVILGWLKKDELEALFNKTSILLLPSYHEGLPMAILEAMAHGHAVVASNVGGIPEAVSDGVNGFLIEPGDIQSITDRLVRLISNDQLREKMGRASFGIIRRKFDIRIINNKLLNLYEDLIP